MANKQLFLVLILIVTPFILSACGKHEIYQEQPEIIPVEFDLSSKIYDLMDESHLSNDTGLRMAHISDLHHYASSLYDADSDSFDHFSYNNEGRSVRYSGEIIRTFGAEILEENIDILLVSGDLTILGTRESHEDVAEILREIEDTGIDVYITTGNHDINNPNAYRLGDKLERNILPVSPEEFREIYTDFGFSEAVEEHDESLSYMAPLGDDYYILSLDSSWYQNNIALDLSASAGYFVPSLFQWVESMIILAEKSYRQIIVMSHHNFLEHYEIDFDLSNFMIRGGGPVLDLLTRFGVNLAFSGHIHKGDVKRYFDSDLYGVTSSSLAIYPHVYRLIGLENGGVSFVSKAISPTKLEACGKDVSVYNWYRGYHRTFLGQYEKLSREFDKGEAYAMAKYFYLVNLYAQAGWETLLPKSIIVSEGAELFASSSSFLKGFARALPLDTFPEDGNSELFW